MTRLFLRIVVGMLTVLAMATFITFSFVSLNIRERVQHYIQMTLGKQMEFTAQLLETLPPDEVATNLVHGCDSCQYSLRVIKSDDDRLPAVVREALPLRKPFLHMTPLKSALTGVSRNRFLFFTRELSMYAPIQGGKFLLVAGPLPRFGGMKKSVMLAVLLSIVGVTGLVGYLFIRPIVRRVSRLERAASELGAGDLNARVQDEGKDAIGNLAQRFNQTADQLQQLIEGQRHLIQAVSHELRTPAANITFALDLMKNEDDPQRITERLQFLQQEADQLDELITELLEFARVDSGSTALDVSNVPLQELVASILDRMAPQCSAVHVELEGIPAQLLMQVDRRLLRRALENLIRNAHSFARAEIRIRVEESEAGITIDVEDDGPGVAPEERERVFQAFARVDGSRSRESGGTGLGLAIVRRVVELHGGRVFVNDSELGGARFRTEWPKADK